MSGRGTAAGIEFQGKVGAVFGSLMLAAKPASIVNDSLPGRPQKILFEVPSAVDDVKVETDVGVIFTQAKTNISLSEPGKGDLFSAVSQFVAQYRSGIIENGKRRGLDPVNDRLVIATGDGAPATISRDLKTALDRNRTGAATGQPQQLKVKLDRLKDHIILAWNNLYSEKIPDDDLENIVRLISVVSITSAEIGLAQLSLSDVIAVSGQEAALLSHLQNWAVGASAGGTGADVSALRTYLAPLIELSSPPDFRADVSALQRYSDDTHIRLKRFTAIKIKAGDFTVAREITNAVVKAVKSGSVLLTGEPGAGKSGVLHATASELQGTAPVIVLAVDPTINSLDALRADIGLRHPVLSVLAAMAGPRPAYLVIDALDAARGGAAEAVYRKLIEHTRDLDGWHVIASVRTFDLRLGQEWRRLFAGAPFDTANSDPLFPSVRHVKISVLNESELEKVKSADGDLATAINAGDEKLKALVTNPFNLALLAELVRTGLPAASFASMLSRQQLLEKYWEIYVSNLGLQGTVALKNIVDLMLGRQAIEIPEAAINPTVAATVDTLRHEGVLADNLKSKIAFRHHVLFDFAIAQVLLTPDIGDAKNLLKSSDGVGFLLAPALGYWLEHLNQELPPEAYWNTVYELLGADGFDPIARIEIARLVTERVKVSDDLFPIKLLLEAQQAPNTITPFGHIAGAMTSQLDMEREVVFAPWLKLLAVSDFTRHDYGAVRIIVELALNRAATDPDDADLGVVARKLLAAVLADESLIQWLSPSVIPYAAQTFGSDPITSRTMLERLFEPQRFSKYGHIEIWWLATHVANIAKFDSEFAVEIYRQVFLGGDFSNDNETAMGQSWILSLRSNAAQDYAMSYHALNEAFRSVVAVSGIVGARAAAATLNSYERQHNKGGERPAPLSFEVEGAVYHFRPDGSAIWAWRLEEEAQYDDYAKIYTAYVEWSKTAPENQITGLVVSALKEGDAAIVWRLVLQVCSERPEILAGEIWPLARAPEILFSEDCRQAATACVAAIYPFIDSKELELAEGAWLQRDFSHFVNPERAKTSQLGSLFATIGSTSLQTEGARQFLAAAQTTDVKLGNDPPFSFYSEDRAWTRENRLQEMGITLEDNDVAQALRLTDDLKAIREDKADTAANKNVRTLAILDAVASLRAKSESALPLAVDEELTDGAALALRSLIHSDLLDPTEARKAIDSLLELSHHQSPEVGEGTEESFASGPSWGTPSTRIQVVEALGSIIRKEGAWPLIRERYRQLLLADPHPAVRYHALNYLINLYYVDGDEFWDLVELVTQKEKNTANLELVTHTLAKFAWANAEKAEALALPLLGKIDASKRRGSQIVVLIRYLAMAKGLARSSAILNDWIAHFDEYEHELRTVLSNLRHDFIMGFKDGERDAVKRREDAFSVAAGIIDVVRGDVIAWPLRGGAPSDREKAAVNLFSQIGQELYYGTVQSKKLNGLLATTEAQRAFLTRAETTIADLMTIGTPASVHHMVELLEHFVAADPEKCFDLLANGLLRKTGIARYEHESLGAAAIVKLIGLYLADYRYLFQDKQRRQRLIQCLGVFVDAGWPQARALFQRLPELLQ